MKLIVDFWLVMKVTKGSFEAELDVECGGRMGKLILRDFEIN